jgi:hypothetical protein
MYGTYQSGAGKWQEVRRMAMRRILMAGMGLVMLSFVVVPAIAQEEEEPRVTVDFNG